MSTPAKPETALVPKEQTDLMRPEPQAGKLSRLAAFTPSTLTEAIALSKLIANSDLAPRDFKGKPANVLIAMQMGAEVGLAPMAALQNIAVINGRPSIWGDAALGIVVTHPDYEWHKEVWEGTADTKTAIFQIKRKGNEVHVTRFSVADAKKANLWGKTGPWQQYSDRMLQMRARGFGIRDKFPDALRGLGLAEEAMDIPVDHSPAKLRREEGTLEGANISDLVQSTEPNRGHNDTGLQRSKDEQNQPEPKKDPVMCSDCGAMDSHTPECKHFAKAEQDRKTSKQTVKALYLVLAVEKRTKTKDGGDQPFLVLHCVTPDDKNQNIAVWHQSFFDFFAVGKADKNLVCEISESAKGYKSLEHVLEYDGVAFVNDMPATQGTLEIPAKQEEEF
jgi:hypothetical protein